MTSLKRYIQEALIQPSDLGHNSDGLYQAIEKSIGKTNPTKNETSDRSNTETK